MGWMRKKLGIDLTGGGVSDAAGHAARVQAGALQEGQRQLREDVEPFRQLGTEAANLLLSSVFGQTPGAEQEILQNPFFRAMAQQQEQDILSQRAALGLAGSGGTQDMLQRNLLQLGENFLLNRNQQRFNQLFNIAGLGANAATLTGTSALNTQQQLGQLAGMPGMVEAQQRSNLGQQMLQLGILGAATGGFGLLGGGAAAGAGIPAGFAGSTGAGMSSFSDRRLKTGIERVGVDEFGNIYEFRYVGNDQKYVGRMADELLKIRPDAVSVHESGYLQVSDEFRARAVNV